MRLARRPTVSTATSSSKASVGTGHSRVYPVENEEMLTDTVARMARPGDLVIGLGAGTITEWAHALPTRLSGYSLAGAAE